MIAFSVLRHSRILATNRNTRATVADAVWVLYWTVMPALVGVILTSATALRVLFVAASSASGGAAAAAAAAVARKGAAAAKDCGGEDGHLGGEKNSSPLGNSNNNNNNNNNTNNNNNNNIRRAQHQPGRCAGGVGGYAGRGAGSPRSADHLPSSLWSNEVATVDSPTTASRPGVFVGGGGGGSDEEQGIIDAHGAVDDGFGDASNEKKKNTWHRRPWRISKLWHLPSGMLPRGTITGLDTYMRDFDISTDEVKDSSESGKSSSS
jgi:hypothetical protein